VGYQEVELGEAAMKTAGIFLYGSRNVGRRLKTLIRCLHFGHLAKSSVKDRRVSTV
jgi:hypothetical protein